jgi:hypothetical protein
MSLKPDSTAYNILKGTRRLRLISKLNKHCSFHRSLLIDREVRALFKPIARSRAGY